MRLSQNSLLHPTQLELIAGKPSGPKWLFTNFSDDSIVQLSKKHPGSLYSLHSKLHTVEKRFENGRKDNINKFQFGIWIPVGSSFVWIERRADFRQDVASKQGKQKTRRDNQKGNWRHRCCDDRERNQRPLFLLDIFFYELKIATNRTQTNRLMRNRPLHVAGSHYTGCQSQDPVNCSESQDPWDILTSLTSRMFRFMGRLTLIWD